MPAIQDDSHVQEISDATSRCLALAERYFGRKFPSPTISMNLKGRAAGQCRFPAGFNKAPELRFNLQIYQRYTQQFIEEVVPHEVAHLVAYCHYGKRIRPHGKHWQDIMREVMGCEPAVTHSFECEPARRMQYFDYVCGCEGRQHQLSAIRHGKVQRRQAHYVCRSCREPLNAAV